MLGPNGVGAIVAVAAIAVAALFFENRAASVPATPSPTATATPTASVTPGAEALAPVPTPSRPLPVSVSLAARLPFAVDLPPPEAPNDDATYLYLAGDGRAVAVNLATGSENPALHSGEFPPGTRRFVVDNGLWVSAWPGGRTCDAACSAVATTQWIDPTSGRVRLTLTGRSLVGLAGDGVWVAGSGVLERLDVASGRVVGSVTWTALGEPRAGCERLWSVAKVAGAFAVTSLDEEGNGALTAVLAEPLQAGPTRVSGECLAITASDPSAAATLVRFADDGSIAQTAGYGTPVALLGGALWTWSAEGKMQRLDPATGVAYGDAYAMPPEATDGGRLHVLWARNELYVLAGDRLLVLHLAAAVPG